MNRYEYLVTFTMNSYTIIEILVFIIRSKLYIYVFTDT